MYIKKISNGSWRDGTYYYNDPNCTILHRENGPAIIWSNGDKEWWINGIRHREDGPAVIYSNGDKYYYLNNKLLTRGQYIQYINQKYICPAKKTKILKRCT